MVASSVVARIGVANHEAIAAAKHVGTADLQRCHDLGAALATGLAMGVY